MLQSAFVHATRYGMYYFQPVLEMGSLDMLLAAFVHTAWYGIRYSWHGYPRIMQSK